MSQLPKLIRFYIRNIAIGFILSAGFVVLLLWQDVAGLGGLVMSSDVGPLAAFLLWFFNGLVFSGAQTSVAVLCMSERKETPPRGSAPVYLAEPVLISKK